MDSESGPDPEATELKPLDRADAVNLEYRPPPVYEVRVLPCLALQTAHPPGWIRRCLQRILCGWKWHKVNQVEKVVSVENR